MEARFKMPRGEKTILRRTVHPRARIWGVRLFSCLLFLLLSHYLETSLLGHMLVQIPLLVMVGAYGSSRLPSHWRCTLEELFRIAGVVLATLTLAFWMIPKSLDSALTNPMMEVAKYLTLPLLAGAPLSLSWSALEFVGKSFIVLNSGAMLAAVGYLYLIAPLRLCNAYLINQQAQAGEILIVVSAVLVIVWFALCGRFPVSGE